MKHLNFLSSLGSQHGSHSSVTLASTVGSPSAHRRSTMLKLLSVLVLIFTFGIGQMWGADATMAAGTNGSTATVSGADAIKVGTSSKGGTMTITVPSGANVLHLKAAAWNGVSGLSLNITPTNKVGTTSIALTANSGIANNSPFTFSGDVTSSYMFDIPLNNISSNTTLTFTSSTTKRFVVWGAKVCYNPTALTNGTITSNSARVSWTDSHNVNSYDVYRSTSNSAPAANATPTATVTNKYADLTGLNAGTTYYWWVRAKDGDCKTNWIAGSSFTTTAAAFTITAQSNNTSYGTVSGTTTITASPKSGYRVSTSNPYSVSPANSATVSQNGNAFTVTPSANTTVTINFEPIPTHKISFNTGGLVDIDDATGIKEGDTYNITQTPAASLTENCEYGTFVGWTTASGIADAGVKPAIITNYQMGNADRTLYAVYSKTISSGGSNGSIEITRLTTNFPTSYGTANTFTEYSLNDYNFKIQQVYNNNNATGTGAQTMQWRASGNSSGTGTIYNTETYPGHISSIVVVYASDDSGKNHTLKVGDSENPTSGTAITPTIDGNTYTFDCSEEEADYFVLTNGSGAGYLTSFTINYGASGTTTYSLDANCCDPLGQINGSVSCTQTDATLTWDKKDNAEWEVSYKVKGAQGDPSTANVGDIDEKQDDNTKLQCSITELEPGTDYEFYVYAVAEGYCEEEKTWKIEGSTDASFTIIAQSNNESYGTVSLSGTTINATLADYCQYATPAYTVTSGTATVSQNGNEFTVTPSTDCTVQINFEPIPVTGVTMSSDAETLEVGGTVTLTPTVSPDGANPDVTWESSDPTVATVSNGTVTATQKAGTTIITCKSSAYPAQLANCTITVVPVAYYKKVTAELADWSGEYLLVYEPEETTAYVWTGVDAASCYASITIPENGKITKPNGAAKLSIASMENEGEYSIKIIGGDNNNKYLSNSSSENKFSFGNAEAAYTLGFNETSGDLEMSNNNKTIRFNPTNTAQSTQLRFRPYGSGQQPVQLYRKVVASAVTITAPATGTGTLALADGETPVASGANVDAGTTLTVSALPNTEAHYISGTISVKKTSDNSDVPNSVWNGTTLTMPEYAITVSATFTPTYAITAATGITGGSFSWEETTGHTKPTYAAAGTQIQASANAANGYVFDAYDIYQTGASATKVSHTNGLFTMPAYAVTIGGSFNEAPTITLSQTSTMAFSKVATGTSTSAKFTVSAANLTAGSLSVTKGGTNPDKFGLSVSSIDVTDGAVSNAEVTVTPVTTETGDFTATITVDDGNGGAEAQSFNVTLHVEDDYTIQWYVNGTAEANKVKTQKAFANDDLDIPTASDLAPFTDCSEFIFLGWKDGSAIDGGSSTSAPTLADVGTKVAASKNYYAVFGDGSPEVDESDSWDLTSTSAAWTGSNTETYFTKPYGMKKENAYIVNNSISDFENYANNADEVSITVTCFQNSGSTSRLTVYLVDEDGAIIAGTGKEFTPANGSQVSDAADSEVTYNASELSGKDATGYMVKCTTYGKNILITGTSYEITKAESYSKYYTTCPQIKTVVLSAASVEHGSISFKVGGKVATSARTDEDDVVVDIVASPETGYELTGISLSELSGASYNSTTKKIELAQNTNGSLTVTATFEETDYIVTLNHTEGVEPTMTGDTEEAHYGGTINLTTTIPSNAIFVNWTSSDVTITNPTSATAASFTMPAKNVTVTANFERLYTVAEALALVPEAGDNSDYVYVGGLISYVDETSWDEDYKNINYYISANGTRENELLVYHGYKGYGKVTFDAITDIKAGDKVIVYGKLTNYQGTKEFAQNNKSNVYSYIYQFTEAILSSVEVGGTLTKTDYFINDDFTREGLTAAAVYSNTGYSKDITDEATWTNNLAGGKVTEDGTVRVTATYNTVSGYKDVEVTVTTKVLESIELSETALTGYLGQAVQKPATVTAHFDDNGVKTTENVTAFASFDDSDYDASSTAEQTITVSYQFGNAPAQTADYTITLSSIKNTIETAYTVEKGRSIIDLDNLAENNLELDDEGNKVFVQGYITDITSNKYTIKDNIEDTEFIEIYEGTLGDGISSVKVGDLIKVEGNLYFYENNSHTVQKHQILNGEIVAVVRTPNLTVADVAEMEVNITADLAEADLTIDKDGSNGAITFSCSDAAVTIVNNKLHAAAAGDATVTATIAADGIYTSAETTFSVHVIAERDRYAITMDADGGTGTDPVYANQLAGATVDLPANNTYSKANSAFDAWVVTETESGDAVAVTNGHFTMPAAAVTIKATWNDVETCTISFRVSGEEVATADAPQTAEYTITQTADNVNGYEFVGWAESEETEDVETVLTTISSYTPALNEDSKILYAVFRKSVEGGEVTDEITNADLAATGSGYVAFTNVTISTSAVYAGTTSKSNGIQMNADSPKGMVTTTTGGLLKNISIEWNSGCTANRVLDVYAKNTAYAGSSDLWGAAAAQGTKVTSFTNDGSTTSYDFEADYAYIGVRSNDKALNINKISITWETAIIYYTTNPVAKYNIKYRAGDAENVTGLCDAERTWGTINLCDAPTCADKNFVKWSDGTSLYDAGAEYTLSADVTFTATWTPKPKYTVTYTANGGTGTAPDVEEYMEGETVEVKNNTFFSKPGFDYDGWLIVYNDGVRDQEITPENGEFRMVAYNVTIKAKWAEESKQKWALVTDVEDLKAGDKYIIAAAGSNVAMAGQNDNNRAETAVVKRNEGAQLKGTSSMQVITLEGTTGAWEFNTGAGYLYAASSSKNYLRTQAENDANGKWTITISDGVASITATGSNTNNQLKYNSGSKIFSCYGSGQQTVALYKEIPMTVINDNSKDQDDVPDGGDMTIKEDKTWTVTEDKEVGDLYMEDGAIIANSAKVEANDLYFKTKKGKSNQIVDASQLNVIGDLYYDVQLCDGDLDADYWYSIAVPFDVDLNSGVFQADGSPMTNRVDFEVWGYDTQLRAQTQSNGWKRVNDNMMHAGKAYLIGFNPGQTNIIRLKAAEGWKTSLFSGTSISVADNTGSGVHDNWNGLANPTMRYIDVNKKTEVFNNNTHEWDSYDPEALSFNFVVGTAFFVQSANAVTISNTDHGNYRAPKRESENKCAYAVRITREDAKDFDNQIIVRASEDATGEYTQGHDMLTMNGTSSNTAAMLWTENYGGKRLAIEEAAWLNGTATYTLKVYAPAAGAYSISVAEAKANADLYLTKDGSIIWNLSMGAYELELAKGTTNGYGLLLQAKAPQTPTGVEQSEVNHQPSDIQKIIIDDNVFILRGGQMYDVTGKAVK